MIRLSIACINLAARYMWLYSPITHAICENRSPFDCLLGGNAPDQPWALICIVLHFFMFFIDWKFESSVNLLWMKLLFYSIIMHGYTLVSAWALIELLEPIAYVLYSTGRAHIEFALLQAEIRIGDSVMQSVIQYTQGKNTTAEMRQFISEQVKNVIDPVAYATARFTEEVRARRRMQQEADLFYQDNDAYNNQGLYAARPRTPNAATPGRNHNVQGYGYQERVVTPIRQKHDAE